MKDLNLLIAGFGGQGVLFTGKVVAYAGMLQDKELSWLPSYGPEMRGGTANCSVCISENPIASPLVVTPNVLIVMNQPSLDKFIDAVEPGGIVLLDSSMVNKEVTRQDIQVFSIPATEMAEQAHLGGLSNMILLGKMRKETEFCTPEVLDQALQKCIPARKASMLDLNRQAFSIGADA